MDNLSGYMTSDQLLDWAKVNLHITKPNAEMTEDEFQRAMKVIGACAVDAVYTDGNEPTLGRIGIGLMLFVTLMEFPHFYERHKLSQWH